MITPRLYETLPQEERKYWHSHVFEVKSGMLIMPQGILPEAAWEAAENKEMEQVVELYGKVYHLWQVDRGDKLPMGEPQLMTSYTKDGQLDFEEVRKRDRKFGVDFEKKKEGRKYIKDPEIHPGMCLVRPADWLVLTVDYRCGPGMEGIRRQLGLKSGIITKTIQMTLVAHVKHHKFSISGTSLCVTDALV